jgi:hypothetical protein
MAENTETRIVIDGAAYTVDDLTFAEQLALRDLCRQTAGDPEAQPLLCTLPEFLPALVTVVKRRTTPDFPLERALELKLDDVLKAPAEQPAVAELDEADPQSPDAA